ncbi:hypothetical protein NKG05_10330 [Oerskovia sp. M15]
MEVTGHRGPLGTDGLVLAERGDLLQVGRSLGSELGALGRQPLALGRERRELGLLPDVRGPPQGSRGWRRLDPSEDEAFDVPGQLSRRDGHAEDHRAHRDPDPGAGTPLA